MPGWANLRPYMMPRKNHFLGQLCLGRAANGFRRGHTAVEVAAFRRKLRKIRRENRLKSLLLRKSIGRPIGQLSASHFFEGSYQETPVEYPSFRGSRCPREISAAFCGPARSSEAHRSDGQQPQVQIEPLGVVSDAITRAAKILRGRREFSRDTYRGTLCPVRCF